MRPRQDIAALTFEFLLLSGCTTGKVVDTVTGKGIEGATVEVWPVPAGAPDGGWPDPSPAAPFKTTTAMGTSGTFWFDQRTKTTSGSPDNPSAQLPVDIDPGWVRMRVTAPDHVVGIFWRNHQFNSTCRDWSSPDPNAVEPCDQANYPLVPSAPGNDLLPDIVADISRLPEYEYDCEGNTRTMFVTAASANIGTGPLELTADDTNAYQNIYVTGGNPRKVQIDGQIVYHPQHGHLHYSNWLQFRIISPDMECQANPWERDNTKCVLAQGDKTSSCLQDNFYFDNEATDISGIAVPVYGACIQPKMGISPGIADVYDKTLVGQDMDVTSVPPGDYILELEMDPTQAIIERTHDNNVARIPVTIPNGCD